MNQNVSSDPYFHPLHLEDLPDPSAPYTNWELSIHPSKQQHFFISEMSSLLETPSQESQASAGCSLNPMAQQTISLMGYTCRKEDSRQGTSTPLILPQPCGLTLASSCRPLLNCSSVRVCPLHQKLAVFTTCLQPTSRLNLVVLNLLSQLRTTEV